MTAKYNGTLAADGSTPDITIDTLGLIGINVEGPAIVEVSHNSDWNELARLEANDSRPVFATGPTIRVRDLSGAANPVTVYA